jgi:hypothetical protein
MLDVYDGNSFLASVPISGHANVLKMRRRVAAKMAPIFKKTEMKKNRHQLMRKKKASDW